jgi:hypothetical protein
MIVENASIRKSSESDLKNINDFFQKTAFPYEEEDTASLYSGNTRLVHYTSADSAAKILKSKTFLMRNARATNDVSEIDYGTKIFVNHITNINKNYSSVLKDIDESAAEKFDLKMSRQIKDAINNTYISCFAEHKIENLNLEEFGLLSMWRSYGVPNGVCIVLKTDAWSKNNFQHLIAPLYKIKYDANEFISTQMEQFFDEVDRNKSLLKKLPDYSIDWIVEKFKCDILSTKHPIFREENEWRSIFAPKRHGKSIIKQELLKKSKSLPELVYKIPLEKSNNYKDYDLSIENFIEHIYIGPSKNPSMLRATFVHMLEQCGVSNPESRVHIADVPLRV